MEWQKKQLINTGVEIIYDVFTEFDPLQAPFEAIGWSSGVIFGGIAVNGRYGFGDEFDVDAGLRKLMKLSY